jgi:acetoin utilization deacetylase AcuC-like enzyme
MGFLAASLIPRLSCKTVVARARDEVPVVHYVQHPFETIDIGPHVFPIEKYGIVARLLRDELGVEASRVHGPDAVSLDDLRRVHTPAYVDDLVSARRTHRTLSSELPVRADVIEGFRRMAGGTVAAVRLALDHGVGFHIGGGFHHAFPDHAEGFCYVHDVAIALERARAEGRVERALVVDVDVHQGNGTAVIYAGDPRTFTYSIHQEHNYPVKQTGNLDRGLADGTTDAQYLEGLREDLDEIDRRFEPDLVCYLAGVDPCADDQLGGLALTPGGLEARDRLVLSRYSQRRLPVVVVLAGGYAPTSERTARLQPDDGPSLRRAVAAATRARRAPGHVCSAMYLTKSASVRMPTSREPSCRGSSATPHELPVHGVRVWWRSRARCAAWISRYLKTPRG